MGLFAFFDFLGPSGLLLAVVAVLLYGERLPEVARTFGKQYMDLKNSIRGLREDLLSGTTGLRNGSTTTRAEADHDREEATAPKFEPPPAETVTSALPSDHAEPLKVAEPSSSAITPS